MQSTDFFWRPPNKDISKLRCLKNCFKLDEKVYSSCRKFLDRENMFADASFKMSI